MLLTVLKFFASLSILIVLHEFGHYIAARVFGVRVKKFYLFFDFFFPFPNLANFSLFKKKVGDTEYGIGWFPFGGYVQMAGIMDESMDEEELKQPPKPDEFRSKPAWQRLIILLGGIIVNILLAMIIYSGLSWTYGKDTLPNSALEKGYYVDEYGASLGLKNGDLITRIGDHEVKDATRVRALLFKDIVSEIGIVRDGKDTTLLIDKSFYKDILQNQKSNPVIVEPGYEPIIGELLDGPLKDAGAEIGDQIIAIDTHRIEFFQEVRKLLEDEVYTSGDTLKIEIERTKNTTEILNVVLDETGRLGFAAHVPVVHEEIGFFQSLYEGPRRTWTTLVAYIGQFKMIFDKDIKGYKQLGGFGTIAKAYKPGKNDNPWRHFWSTTAFISVILAFMNLLPIPALDGGHALFTIYEIIMRRPPPEKFLQYAQATGMILLLFLLLYANGMDIVRWWFEK